MKTHQASLQCNLWQQKPYYADLYIINLRRIKTTKQVQIITKKQPPLQGQKSNFSSKKYYTYNFYGNSYPNSH